MVSGDIETAPSGLFCLAGLFLIELLTDLAKSVSVCFWGIVVPQKV